MPNFNMPFYNTTIHEIMYDEERQKEIEEARKKAVTDKNVKTAKTVGYSPNSKK